MPLLLGLGLALAVGVAAGTPRMAVQAGRPTRASLGTLSPRWRVPAAFVHPGGSVPAPIAGVVVSVAEPGLVAAGAVLAWLEPEAPQRPRAGSGLLRSWVGVASPPSGGGGTAWLLCAWRGCDAPAPRLRAAATLVPVRAAQAGWFVPRSDPLALTDTAADSDLPPSALGPPPPAVRPGERVAAGASLGVLGAPWEGRWLCRLPDEARAALVAAGGASLVWSGGPGAEAQLLAAGPTVAGGFLATLGTDRFGAVPSPPRTTLILDLPSYRGVLVPKAAVRGTGANAAVWVRTGSGGIRRQSVRVLVAAQGTAVVSGLPPGATVLGRPWFLVRWLAAGS